MWPAALADLVSPGQSFAMVRSYIERYEGNFIDLREAASALSKRKIEGEG